jgi:hypothetical protein
MPKLCQKAFGSDVTDADKKVAEGTAAAGVESAARTAQRAEIVESSALSALTDRAMETIAAAVWTTSLHNAAFGAKKASADPPREPVQSAFRLGSDGTVVRQRRWLPGSNSVAARTHTIC